MRSARKAVSPEKELTGGFLYPVLLLSGEGKKTVIGPWESVVVSLTASHTWEYLGRKTSLGLISVAHFSRTLILMKDFDENNIGKVVLKS